MKTHLTAACSDCMSPIIGYWDVGMDYGQWDSGSNAIKLDE
jgi:hypothetical protein